MTNVLPHCTIGGTKEGRTEISEVTFFPDRPGSWEYPFLWPQFFTLPGNPAPTRLKFKYVPLSL